MCRGHPVVRCPCALRWCFLWCRKLCFKMHVHTQKIYICIYIPVCWCVFCFVFFLVVVMGSPATRSSGKGSFCLGNILIRVEIEDGGRKAKWRVAGWEGGGVGDIGGIFQSPCGIVVRGGRRQSICHPALNMSQRSILCSSNGL